MRYCTKCGKELEDNMLFCSECGNPTFSNESISNMDKKAKRKKYGALALAAAFIFIWLVADADNIKEKVNSVFGDVIVTDEITGNMGTLDGQIIVSGVKNVYFDTYSRSISFGEALDYGTKNVVWDCTSRSDGQVFIVLTGEYASVEGGQFTLELQAQTNGDYVYVEVVSGEFLSELVQLSNATILSTIYSMAEQNMN